jgi:hypothetical protein
MTFDSIQIVAVHSLVVEAASFRKPAEIDPD